jgi:hypothetical protein
VILIGDRAYDSDPLDDELQNDGIELIAPHRSNRRLSIIATNYTPEHSERRTQTLSLSPSAQFASMGAGQKSFLKGKIGKKYSPLFDLTRTSRVVQ